MNTKKQNSNLKKETPNSKLQKSSVIFMQLGLILALLFTYVTLEHKSIMYHTGLITKTFVDPIEPYIGEIDIVKKEKIKIIKPIVKKQTNVIITKIPKKLDDIKIVDNTVDVKPIDLKPTETNENVPVKPINKPITTVAKPKVDKTVHINFVENVPTFLGCTGTNAEKKKCFNKKINQHIQRNFDIDLAQDLGLSEGKKRIRVQFIIDEKGNVVEIIAKAPHKKLEKEAKRIIKKLPKMSPGKQNNSFVRVKYSLPINFNIED